MDFSLTKKYEGADVTLTPRERGNGITLVDVDVKFRETGVPAELDIGFSIPCVDMYSTWGAYMRGIRNLCPAWRKSVTSSRLASGAPLHSVLSYNGRNRLTVALSDAKTPTAIATGVKEEDARLYCEIRFFTEPVNAISEYHATVYIDLSDRPYYEALKAAEKYWRDECGYGAAYVPDAARRPMYSCWYSFHQKIDVEAILAQCRLAKKMGMETVIVDDGWQTEDGSRGYAYCGDWKVAPGKVKDMKEFVDRVHEIGMKFMLWYSVPAVGRQSAAYERFQDMTLNKPTSPRSWMSLDPRFPEVRSYLVGIYSDAVRDFGLDGLKLDFIDSFRLFPETPAFDERWDTLSLEEGVDRLLSEIMTALRAINPEILIEFRQSYFGPTIRKYGNMMRVSDCPDDSFMNHLSGADMRFSLGSTPVHSDMLMWHPEDSVVSAAHQVICSLFTVPQISVLLDKITDDQRQMLSFWLGFWNENRDVLLGGDFRADNPESSFSLVRSSLGGREIAVAHAKPVLDTDGFESLCFINASGGDYLILRAGKTLGTRNYRVTDCLGRAVEEGSRDLDRGVHEFTVPPCGMLSLF